MPYDRRSPFVQRATLFEDFVIRCVRWAFANLDPNVGRIFFSKYISIPFLRFRMARHGYFRPPVSWREVAEDGPRGHKGIWIEKDACRNPDVVIYYAHGGGFAMGSSYFYLEFLLSWHALLAQHYDNPAIFALEYTLVPDEKYPVQVYETLGGYKRVLRAVNGDPHKIVVAGDSAGGTLMLSMLIEQGLMNGSKSFPNPNGLREGPPGTQGQELRRSASETPPPELCVLISPWTKLISRQHKNTESDYLDHTTLWKYGLKYAGSASTQNWAVSPGLCKDMDLWAHSSPRGGFFITYGSEEVFAPEIEELLTKLSGCTKVESSKEVGGIHAWPVVSLFLSSARQQRLKGLESLTSAVKKSIQRQSTSMEGKNQSRSD
ncbi:putative steryl acetyl hydrolase mug81 [Colletotrichum sidae]|uniref:Putative steryl acetyl hydrolase mug81 n=1 Tax=Colletotrichum sidae TaxID=1347389 RepID=A0A4R8S7B2_9PEZI|nr:putative steryl acetyl hydrolase mug81 [Colletotrichum sidae]